MADQRALQIEDVRGSGVYPATGPLPPGNAVVRTPAGLAHPEERAHTRRLRVPPDAALLAGRAIFGGYFLYNGINHFLSRHMLTEYAGSKGVPAPALAVAASGLLIVAGGLSLLTGVRPKVGAGLITAFLLGVSPRMHAFWHEPAPQQRINEMVNFTKNMALVGASLIAASHPEPWPWRISVPGTATTALVPARITQ